MAQDARKANLAKIHIAKKQLGLDDDTYRAALKNITGKQSAADLTLNEQLKVLAHFKAHGFAPQAKPKTRTPKRPHTFTMPEREALMTKIEALLLDGGYTWKYADGIAKRVCKIECVAWCTPPDLRKIVAALTYNAKRQGRAYKKEQAK